MLACLVVVTLTTGSAFGQSGRGWMEGFVVGESDNPGIDGATVELTGDPSAPSLRTVKLTTTSDSTGKYAIKDIPHGPYVLRVSAPGYATYRIPIYILSDTLTQLHVRLKRVRGKTRG